MLTREQQEKNLRLFKAKYEKLIQDYKIVEMLIAETFVNYPSDLINAFFQIDQAEEAELKHDEITNYSKGNVEFVIMQIPKRLLKGKTLQEQQEYVISILEESI